MKNNISDTTLVSSLLGLLFLATGLLKLLGQPMVADQFKGWGYPRWFMYLTGGVEVSAAFLVLLPMTRLYGVLLIVPTMMGAIITHLRFKEWLQLPLPLALLGAAAWLGRAEEPLDRIQLRVP